MKIRYSLSKLRSTLRAFSKSMSALFKLRILWLSKTDFFLELTALSSWKLFLLRHPSNEKMETSIT